MSFHTPAHKQTSTESAPGQFVERQVARFERQTREWWVREIAYAHLEIERDQWAQRRADERAYLHDCFGTNDD